MAIDLEELGKIVRATWFDWCVFTGDTKPSHLAPWEELTEWDKEVDRRIGLAVANHVSPPPHGPAGTRSGVGDRERIARALFAATNEPSMEFDADDPYYWRLADAALESLGLAGDREGERDE